MGEQTPEAFAGGAGRQVYCYFHLGGGSKSDSRSEGSEGEDSWSSCVREADDVFWHLGKAVRAVEQAGVSSVTAYVDGREELTVSRGVASVVLTLIVQAREDATVRP